MNIKLRIGLVMIGIIILTAQQMGAAQKGTTSQNKPSVPSASPTTQALSGDEKALREFQQVVDDFTKFFKSNPKFVSKERTITQFSKDGIIEYSIPCYVVQQYVFQEVAFDVRKTDSLVSPYTGYIDLSIIDKNNGSCGDVSGSLKSPVGHSNIETALMKGDDSACLVGSPQKRRFEFVYQSGKWVLKNARSLYRNEFVDNDRLAAVFGMRENEMFLFLTEPSGLKYNEKLYKSMKPYLQ